MRKLFVSYSHKDKIVRQTIKPWLEGLYIVTSDDDIYPGEEWEKKIKQLIRESHVVVFLNSEASSKSMYCNKEIEFALKQKKHILPVKISDGTPLHPKLDHLQELDSSGGFGDKEKKSLSDALARIAIMFDGKNP